jgi:hypothetical protein
MNNKLQLLLLNSLNNHYWDCQPYSNLHTYGLGREAAFCNSVKRRSLHLEMDGATKA